MSGKLMLTVLSLFAVAAIYCGCEDGSLCVNGRGDTTTKTVVPNAFTKVHLIDLDAEVFVELADRFEVTVEAEENVQDVIRTTTVDDVLSIEQTQCLRKHDDITIRIKTKSLEGIKLSSDGSIRVDTLIEARNFEVIILSGGRVSFDSLAVSEWLTVEHSGSGQVEFVNHVSAANLAVLIGGRGAVMFGDLWCDEATATFEGNGQLFLYNTSTDCAERAACRKLNVAMNAGGYLMAYDLCSRYVAVETSGSGGVFVNALVGLQADISGSGDVYYRGNPTLTVRGGGSGKVSKGQ